MAALKLVAEQKNDHRIVNDYAQLSEADLLNLFPLPRYFQIHFQYAHDNAAELKAELAELKQTARQMELKIDLLVQLLKQTSR